MVHLLNKKKKVQMNWKPPPFFEVCFKTGIILKMVNTPSLYSVEI